MTKQLDPNLLAAKGEMTAQTKGAFDTVELTPKQKNQWDMTRSAVLWNCPAFTYILMTMMQQGNGDIAIFTKDIPTAATDGSSLILNPEFFFSKTLQERVFIIAHEVSHAIFDHCGQMYMFSKRGKVLLPSGKSIDYFQQTMNVAMDLVINDMLVESQIGVFVKGGCHDTSLGKSQDSIIDVYEKVYKEDKKKGGNGGGGAGQGGFDQHLQPGKSQGKDPQKAQSERSPMEWSMATTAAMASAKAQGKLPAAMERLFNSLLEPEVPWGEKIQAFFARKVGSSAYDYRRPDRRLIVRDIYAPGRSGFGAGNVVISVDTSGSIGQPELDTMFAEMRGILSDVRPRKVYVIWCDAMVHKVDEITDIEDLNSLKPVGGGGTCFKPPFEWVEKNIGESVDCMVYFTDGYGSFPDRAPNYPVLWGDIEGRVKYPWGEVVSVPVKAKK